ncbi:MAG: DUF11 domain-containing protein [Dehalococcoidia bacterium]|nr:DUF11 domain-containing protein [Dehalococcoidia bacterium]
MRQAIAATLTSALILATFATPEKSTVMAASEPIPSATPSAPAEVFLNEGFTLTVSFDNIATGDNTGFGPIVEVLVPPAIDVLSDSASYLGADVNVIDMGLFGTSGELINPLTNLTVSGTEGFRLLIIEYPLGSFTTQQPAAAVTLDCELNSLAVLGTPLTIATNPMFRYGADAEDNPTSDPPTIGSTATVDVTPTVMRLTKKHDAHESETATGPNYPVTYTLTVDIATDANIDNLIVTDEIPDNMQFIDVVADAGGSVSEPSTTTPGGTLEVHLGDVTGTGADDDVVIKYRAYAPELDASDDDVLDADTGAPAAAENDASASGTYDDDNGGVYVEDDDAVVITLRSIATQKGVDLSNDVNAAGISPGDTLEYTIDFQISDYFAFQDIVLTDVIGDGQSFEDSPVPHLNVTEGGTSDGWDFEDGNTYTWSHDGSTGETSLTFYVSNLLNDEDFGYNKDGSMEGDIYHNGSWNEEPATGTITFFTTIDEAYEDPGNYDPLLDEYLGSGDSTGNVVDIDANLLDTTTAVSDGSSAGVTIDVPTLTKTVYAIDGVTGPSDIHVAPGQTVTYSLRTSVPAGETESLQLTDYLPIPFLEASELTTYDATPSDTPPLAGHWALASDDTLSGGSTPLLGPPTLTVDPTYNTVSFDWGSFEETNATDRVAHLLFTVTGVDEPMADELFLANLAVSSCTDSLGDAHTPAAVDFIITEEPHLTITKGVFSTDGYGTVTPAPGDPVDSDLLDADARDTVTYVITIENDGSWDAHNVTVREDTPAGLSGCTIDSVAIDGSPIISPDDYTGDMFSTPLVLDEPLEADETLTITYTCTIEDTVYPGQDLVNTAQIERYASTDEGPNYVQDESLYQDDATVTIAEPAIDKSLASSTESSTDNPGLTIGETGTFSITVVLPEATLYDPVFEDDVPAELQYISTPVADIITSANTLSTTLEAAAMLTAPPGSNGTLSIAFTGTYLTAGLSEAERTITFSIDLLVLDNVSNSWLSPNKVNTASLSWKDGVGGTEVGSVTDNETVHIVEPNLVVMKDMTPNPATGGQEVTVTLTVENTGTSDAFDVSVSDTLNSGVFDLTSVAEVTTPAGFTYDYSSPTVTYSGATIPKNTSKVFTFTVDVIDLAIAGSSYPNTAVADYSSLPNGGDDDRDYEDSGDDDLAIRRAGIGKSLIATSEPDTVSAGTNVLVGEVMTYELQIDVPASSTTDNLRVADNLPANVAYVSGTAEMKMSSTDVTSTGFPSVGASSFTSVTPTAEPDPITFALGNVVNTSPAGQTIKIRFDVVVKNISSNVSGTTISNRGTITFTNDQGQDILLRSNIVATRVRSPHLTLTKSVAPLSVIGGETVTFTLIVENQNVSYGGPAFDLTVTDALNAYYTNLANVGWTVLQNTGPAIVVTDSSTTALDIEIDRLDPGDKLEIEFEADVVDHVPHGVLIPNISNVVGTSLPGDHGTGDATPGTPGSSTGERIGDGSGSNNLWASDDGEVAVYLPTIDKGIVAPQPRYAIGDEFTYRVVMGVPAGYSDCLGIRDSLPDGVSFVPGTLTVDVPSAVTVANTPTDESNSTFFYEETPSSNIYWFKFGETTASDSSDIVLEYTVVVDDEPSNVDGTNLDNEAQLHQLVEADCILLETDSASAVVGEPNVEVTKSIISNTADLQNGDTVTFQIDLENVGSMTAYVVGFVDTPAPDRFVRPVDSLVIASFTPVPVFDNDALTLSTFDLPPGESVTVYVTATLTGVIAAETVENTAAVTYSSLSGGEGRDYNDEDDASFPIDSGVTITKEPCSCMPDSDFSIGEHVVYRVQVDILEVKTLDMTVTDTLPAGLDPLRTYCQVISGNGGIVYYEPGTATVKSDYDVAGGTGQEVVFELGDVDNPANGIDSDDYIVMDMHAMVVDDPGNASTTVLTNNVEVEWTDGSGTHSGTSSAENEIVEPDMEILKTVDRVETTVGDEVVYTLTVRHTPQSTAAAHDVVIVDTLASDMDYVDGSATLAPSDYTSDPTETLTFTIPTLTLAEHQVTISYTCRLDDDPSLAEPTPVNQHNVAVLTYTSLEGESDEDRSYTDEVAEDVTPIIWTSITADKTVLDENGGELIGGEILAYTIILTNEDDSIVRDVKFTDPIPAHTTYVPGSLQTDKAGATIDDSGSPLIVYVGDMAIGEAVTITFRVRVFEAARSGTVIRNIGIVDSSDTTPSPTDDPTDDESDADPTDTTVIRPGIVVGGEAFTANKAALMAPWLALAGLSFLLVAWRRGMTG